MNWKSYPWGLWAETAVLVLILLVVAWYAGRASFTNVHDWTMAHSPVGTPDWFGWANAVISELVPLASLLVIRRRRRSGESIAYPMFLLMVALLISITAQLSQAKPGVTGGVVAVIPALAFAALAKLILGKTNRVTETATVPPTPVTPTVAPVASPAVFVTPEPVAAPPVSSPNGHRSTALIGTVTR